MIEFANTLPRCETPGKLSVRNIESARRLAASTAGSGSWGNTMLALDVSATTGKWVYETTISRFTNGSAMIGWGGESDIPAGGSHMTSAVNNNTALYLSDGKIWNGNAGIGTAYTGAPESNVSDATFTLYIDMGTRKIWIARNGVYLFDAAGDPAAGTNEAHTIGGTNALEPMVSIYNNATGWVALHRPEAILYPADGFVPYGFAAATITFVAGAITDAAGASVTESGVVAIICDRATGAELEVLTGVTITGGACTLSFAADVANGQTVVVHLHNPSGSFKSGGHLATVTV